jgi:hypothetical protein
MRIWNANLPVRLAHESMFAAGDRTIPAERAKAGDEISERGLPRKPHPGRPIAKLPAEATRDDSQIDFIHDRDVPIAVNDLHDQPLPQHFLERVQRFLR